MNYEYGCIICCGRQGPQGCFRLSILTYLNCSIFMVFHILYACSARMHGCMKHFSSSTFLSLHHAMHPEPSRLSMAMHGHILLISTPFIKPTPLPLSLSTIFSLAGKLLWALFLSRKPNSGVADWSVGDRVQGHFEEHGVV